MWEDGRFRIIIHTTPGRVKLGKRNVSLIAPVVLAPDSDSCTS